MVTYKPTVHKSGLRTSRLGTARKNYASAEARHSQAVKNLYATYGGNMVNRPMNAPTKKTASDLRSAKKTLEAETKIAKDYYKKVMGSR